MGLQPVFDLPGIDIESPADDQFLATSSSCTLAARATRCATR
jgi:hypothetical protein